MSRVRLPVLESALAVSADLAEHGGGARGRVAEADVRRPGHAAPPTGEEIPAFEFRLSEGTEAGETPVLVARPEAERITDAEARGVLDRLPPLAALLLDEPFAIREASLPPPRAGRSVRASFPPEDEAARLETTAAGPLEVLRRMPEGDVPLAPHLSMTFSEPMVALDSHQGIGRESVPARLTPQPPGEWRWVGTRTLVFEPEVRFPMATDYRVEVEAGTRAAGGATLARASSWSFSTPPLRLVAQHPEGGPARRDTLMLAAFDQRVDPVAVLASLRVRAGGANFPVRLASAAEVEADPEVARLGQDLEPGRFFAFRTESVLPADATVTVTVGAGSQSAEGPRTTAVVQEWNFRTYGPFRVRRDEHERDEDERLTPSDPWWVELTNPVDPATLREDAVSVTPRLTGLKLFSRGERLLIRGVPRGRTTYRVTLSSQITDVFGQTLEPGRALRFKVGSAPADLLGPEDDFVVLDPAGGARFPVRSVNLRALRVEAYAVGPEDWWAWLAYRRSYRDDDPVKPPGRRVIDATVRLAPDPDAVTETLLDVGPALPSGLGQVVLVVRPASGGTETRSQEIRVWVQATRIGLDAFADDETLVAWASDLADGRPLDNVELRLGNAGARSDASGLARFTLSEAPAPLLVARRGRDVAILPRRPGRWAEGEGWRRTAQPDTLRFLVFDDRKLYRPGESVHVKGWLRRIGAGTRGDVETLPSAVSALHWTLVDSHRNEVGKGDARVGGLGGFDLAVALPKTMNLGAATLLLEVIGWSFGGQQHPHVFQVQEFRRPEFEVKATASEGPFLVGDGATVTVSAAYYAGGALPGADVSWLVTATPGDFRPPNRDDFSFGTFVPWWDWRPRPEEPEREETMAAFTDGSGVHRLRIDFDRGDPPRPRVVRAEATVMDVNRQAWTARANLLVHPAERYVGLRAERTFVQKGEPIAIDVIATDLEGGAAPGRPVRLRAERLDWEQVEGEWKEVPKDVQEWEVQSAAEPVYARFEAKEGGAWRVIARIADERGRENETELRVWVAGGRVPPRRDLEEEKVTLVPDRKEYRAGDVAKVLVLAPFAPAEGVLTLRRSGLVREERFTMTGGSHTLAIPVEDGFTPNVHVQVDLVGQAPREETPASAAAKAPARPAFASGSLDLLVPPATRTLTLAVSPRDKALPPGGETTIDLTLRDAAGRAVADGEAAVWVVDEAVLALTGYRLPDPLDVFYVKRGAEVSDHRLRSHVLLAHPEELTPPIEWDAMRVRAVGSDAKQGGGSLFERIESSRLGELASEPIRARTDFAALALFVASVPTDADGHASMTVKLPDSLTRYRVMAVAVSGARSFGSTEATLVARLPLMVRPSAPRFLNFGDRFELPVVVQNQTDAEMTVEVAVRAGNVALTAGAGRRLVVAANDRAEVRFPMAAVRAGQARIQVGAASGAAADAAEVELPVWTPATTEAFATYGQIDEGSVVQPVNAPSGVVPEFGGLEVTTSSTALQALTDAVLYLVAYPFECAEQLSSRVLAVAALRDVLTAFKAEGLPKPEEIEAVVGRTSAGCAGSRTTTAVSVSGAGARLPGPTSPSTRPTPSPARGRRASPSRTRSSRAPGSICAGSTATSPRTTGRTCAARCRPMPCPSARSWTTPTPREPGPSSARRASRGSRSRRSAGSCPSWGGTRPRRRRWPRSVGASRTTCPRPPRRRTSPSPTATAPTCCSIPTSARTRSCSRRSSSTPRRATSSPSSSRACSRTGLQAAGRTPRRTCSSCSPSIATSGPTRRRPPTSWPAPGWASGTRARTSSGDAPPSGTISRSRCPISVRGPARTTWCSRRTARDASTTGSACATRRRASSSSRWTAGSPSSAPTRASTTRATSGARKTAAGTSVPGRVSVSG